MKDDELHERLRLFWQDIGGFEDFQDKQVLLAHYTSVDVVVAIMKGEQLWFSNPLFMNDTQEIRFPFNEAELLLQTSVEIRKACNSDARYTALMQHLDYYHTEFANNEVLNTYVFCLSEHDPSDNDGRLSMWRGYGANGNGAAIVFDTSKIPATEGSPISVAKVRYIDLEGQRKWLADTITAFCKLLEELQLPDDKLWLAAWAVYRRIKFFALFTKHPGFGEEKEWRAVYLRDHDDENLLEGMFDYWVGPQGVEPKLKLKVQHIPGVTDKDFSLTHIIERIILGPSVSSPLSKAMILKMLDHVGKSDLKDRVHASTIPFRYLQKGGVR
jgi:hypothetical protein